MLTAYLQLGSNLGNRIGYIEKSKALIVGRVGHIVSQSEVYESEPWGFQSTNWFLNQAIAVETALNPFEILQQTLAIEALLGRNRRGKSYTSRTIDIDILLIDGVTIDTEDLKIPHPRLPERLFALRPLAQIAPQVAHPILGVSISQLLSACADNLVVQQWRGARRQK